MEAWDKNVKFPFGDASIEGMEADADLSVEVFNNVTIVDAAEPVATANRTLTLTASSCLEVGARVFVKSKTTAVETLTFAGDAIGKVITGVAGKTFTVEFMFDGVNFLQIGAAAQID